MRSSLVVLQTVRLTRITASWHWIRQASNVVVFEPLTMGAVCAERWHERLAWRLLKMLASGKVQKIDPDTRNRLGYATLHTSDVYVEAAMVRVRAMHSYEVVRDLVGHAAVDRMFARLLLPRIQVTSQFYRFAEHLLKTHSTVILVPQDDAWQTHRHFILTGAVIPWTVRWLNVFSRAGRRLAGLVINGAVWPAVLLRHVMRSFRPGRAQGSIVKVQVIIPLVWGLSEKSRRLQGESGEVESPKLQWDNESFLGGELNSQTVAFYYSAWPFTADRRAAQEGRMRELGIQWFDPATFQVDAKHWREVREFAVRAAWAVVRRPRILMEPLTIVHISGLIVLGFLQELLFNHQVEYCVRVECADYDPQSVMRTIVANRFGRATVGVHHSANALTYVLPEVRYAFMNRLCMWHDGFQQAFGSCWNDIECVPIGNHRLDYVLQNLESERLALLRVHIRRRWGVTGPIVLVALPNHPSEVTYQNPERFEELYRAIKRTLDEFPQVCIVLRVRPMADWRRYLQEEPLQALSNHRRVIFDQAELSTPEWIAVADVVISTSTSSVIVEAGAAGKPCFSFDTDGRGEITFRKYGADFVMTTEEQFLRAVTGVLYGHPVLDCDWGRFAREQTYFADGQNIQRFRDAIWDLVDQVRRGGYTAPVGRPTGAVSSDVGVSEHESAEPLVQI